MRGGNQSSDDTVVYAVFERLEEGVILFDRSGAKLFSNKKFSKMWGLTETHEDIEGDIDSVFANCFKLYKSKLFWSEMRNRVVNSDIDKDISGEITLTDNRHFTFTFSSLPNGSKIIFWADVTVDRNAFLNVSYQLRTPLTTISGYADFLQNEGAGELNDKQSEYVFAIQMAAEDLIKTINDILDVAAPDADVIDKDKKM